jgi:hypothetical protein
MSSEEKVLDILTRHGPRTKEEIVQDCKTTTKEEKEHYEQAIEKLCDDGTLYRVYEDRYKGIGNPSDSTNNPIVFLTREWYARCKDNSAYTFFN